MLLWVIAIIIFLLLIWVLAHFYYESRAPAVCSLQKRIGLPDRCVGGCPTKGFVCINTTDRPYGPWGIFGTQHATCNCVEKAWADSLTWPGD